MGLAFNLAEINCNSSTYLQPNIFIPTRIFPFEAKLSFLFESQIANINASNINLIHSAFLAHVSFSEQMDETTEYFMNIVYTLLNTYKKTHLRLWNVIKKLI